jgi:integral membrane protein
MLKNQIAAFRYISLAEGISFLLLLIIAMPLKYMYEEPLMVKYVGWAHGLLFVGYVAMLFYLTAELKWSFRRLFIYFIAALIPLAPFFVERNLRKEYAGDINGSK